MMLLYLCNMYSLIVHKVLFDVGNMCTIFFARLEKVIVLAWSKILQNKLQMMQFSLKSAKNWYPTGQKPCQAVQMSKIFSKNLDSKKSIKIPIWRTRLISLPPKNKLSYVTKFWKMFTRHHTFLVNLHNIRQRNSWQRGVWSFCVF